MCAGSVRNGWWCRLRCQSHGFRGLASGARAIRVTDPLSNLRTILIRDPSD